MNVMDRVRSMFGRGKSVRDLSSSVVKHTRLDDGVLSDFRERAHNFEHVMQNAPVLPVFDKEGNETGSQQVYDGWQDLVSDVFRAHYTYDEPKVATPDEVKPSRELHRRVMSRIINHDDFADTRPLTRLNEWESAASAMAMASELGESLTEALAEHAQRANQLNNEEEQLAKLESNMRQVRQHVQDQGGQATQEQKDALRTLAEQRAQAKRQLAGLAQQQDAAKIGMDAAAVVDRAVEKAKEQAQIMSSLPGVADGAGAHMSPDQMFMLADKVRQQPKLKEILALLGRIERDMRYARANRVQGGHEEIVDIETGSDLAVLLPSELVRLRHPVLRQDFMRRFHENSLLQYELRGSEPAGRGPVVIVLDGSGSMNNDRNVWARAVALSMVNLAHKEHRDAVVIEFSSASQQESWHFPGRAPLDLSQVIACAEHFFGGGTDIASALDEGRDTMVKSPQFEKADVALITDGECNFGEHDQQIRDELRSKGVRILGVAIAHRGDYLAEMCEQVTHVADIALDGANEATDFLATHLT